MGTLFNPVMFGLLIISALSGCAQEKRNEKKPPTVNCILLGYDSIAYYVGNSAAMGDLKRGKLTDTTFMRNFLQTAKEQAKDSTSMILLKPTAAGDVARNFREIVDLLNNNDLQGRSLDTLDSNEQRVFHTTSLQGAAARASDASHRLILPKDEKPPATVNTSSPDRLVILLFGDQGIYVYKGTGIGSGKKYTYSELQKWLQERKSDPPKAVLIKPAAGSTYKNTVNMLDVVKLAVSPNMRS